MSPPQNHKICEDHKMLMERLDNYIKLQHIILVALIANLLKDFIGGH